MKTATAPMHFLLRAIALVGVAFLMLTGCGGSGGSGSTASGGGSSGSSAQNVAALLVDGFAPYGTDQCGGGAGYGCAALNQLYVKLKVCAHGSTSNCQTVDHVAVDTGSIGLRLLSASLQPPTSGYMGSAAGILGSLPTISYVSAGGTGTAVQGTLAECAQFGGGFTWGSVRSVDLTIVGTNESASNVPMQVIGDMEPAPASCVSQSSTGFSLAGANSAGAANPLTYQYLGSNGLIGISLFAQDCFPCAQSAQPLQGSPPTAGLAYAVCTDMTGNHCSPTTVPLAQQVVNPITLLPKGNNGFVINVAAIGPAGQTSVTGTMTLGIGTQANNGLGSATKYLADPLSEPGFVYTTYNSVPNQYGIFDTGSSLYFFSDSTIASCGSGNLASFYCPGGATAPYTSSTTLSLHATVDNYQDLPPSATVPFSIINFNNWANTNTSSFAMNNLGGPQVANYFIWGMPAFYGKTIYFGIQGSGAAPYYAF